ncbi:MAG TPA: hypothetical protein VJ623_13780 [Holophagaceae bacterium]|nr:hypothetical protein [Holophagaceae bacterium]
MNIPNLLRTGLAVAISVLVLGCAGKSTDAAPKFNELGEHPKATWLNTHWQEYAKAPDSCLTCHGSAKDPAKAGGTSQVSCFSCHPNGPGHPEGWAAGNQHGRLGAQAAAGDWSGMASCGRCHGSDFTGGLAKVSCMTCHTKAPHPDKPWFGANASVVTHYMSDESNAAQCAQCHTNGANSTRVPTTPAPAGTTPGCFNNTLCHDRNL